MAVPAALSRPYGCGLALLGSDGLISLVFPLAVRRVIDTFNVEQVDWWISILVRPSRLRRYWREQRAVFANTRLGERVVTDIARLLWPCHRNGAVFMTI